MGASSRRERQTPAAFGSYEANGARQQDKRKRMNHTGPTPRRHNARCVIWRAPDADVPPDLRLALRQRGLWYTECDTACWAVAEVCRLDRDEENTPVILLLLTPKTLDQVEEMLGVCERYAPHAAHWVYDEQAEPKLHTVIHVGSSTSDNPNPRNHNLVGDGPDHLASDNPTSGCKLGQDSPSILSGDELASLKHPERAGESES